MARQVLWCFLLVSAICVPLWGRAQIRGIDIAQRYPLADEIFAFGDIVVYDREALQYRLSESRADPLVFGIAVESPVFLLDDGSTNVPVVRSGESIVNVVAENGPISAGDYITTSRSKGKGERANEDDAFLVGIALGSFAGLETEVVGTEGGIDYGQIPVLLSVGHVSKINEITKGGAPSTPVGNTGFTEATILNVIQYLVAAFIAIGSVLIAFRNFGPNIKTGLDSIGRNPLAKASIQSMITLNVILIALVSLGGLFISLAILLLPI
jgi:hypothetical protein